MNTHNTNRLHGLVCSRCQYRATAAAEQAKFTKFTLHDNTPGQQAVLCPRCTERLLKQLRDFLESHRDAVTVAAMFGRHDRRDFR